VRNLQASDQKLCNDFPRSPLKNIFQHPLAYLTQSLTRLPDGKEDTDSRSDDDPDDRDDDPEGECWKIVDFARGEEGDRDELH
jgi:hypothetical protein